MRGYRTIHPWLSGFAAVAAVLWQSLTASAGPMLVTIESLAPPGREFQIKEPALGQSAPDLQIIITDDTFAPGNEGDLDLLVPGTGALGDIVRFVNVAGQANIFFRIDHFDLNGNEVPVTDAGLPGLPLGAFVDTVTKSNTLVSFLSFEMTSGYILDTYSFAPVGDKNPIGAQLNLVSYAPSSAVPEPTTLVLSGIGTLGLLAAAWRRRSRAAHEVSGI